MDPILENNIITIIVTLIASSGMWTVVLYFFQRKDKINDDKNSMKQSINELNASVQELRTAVHEVKENQQSSKDQECLNRSLLVGLAHDRIIFLGQSYLDRGWISHSDYKTLHDDIFVPYTSLGGNGEAKRMMEEVDKLPIEDHIHKDSAD